MVYTAPNILWTIHWNSLTSSETGQTGFRTSTPGTPPTLSTVTDVANALATTWAAPATAISSTFRFHRLKAALIAVDGDYDPAFNPVVLDRTPVAGGGPANNMPLQTSCVSGLESGFTSGRAKRGRMYWPPLAETVNASGNWNTSTALARSTAVASFLGQVETITGETVQIMSSIGTGTTRPVVSIRTGARPDIQRSRGRDVPEAYQVAPMP